jgi:hypothetical protein
MSKGLIIGIINSWRTLLLVVFSLLDGELAFIIKLLLKMRA